jgi:hypothetical protein
LEELPSLVEEAGDGSGCHEVLFVLRAVRSQSTPLCCISCRMGSCSLRRRDRAEGMCNWIRRGK